MNDSNTRHVVFQGDLAFVPALDVDDGYRKQIRGQFCDPRKTKVVIARGEKSGHQHVVEGTDLAIGMSASWWPGIPSNVTIIVTPEDVGLAVTHDEHQPALLEPATVYYVARQRQYVPEAPQESAPIFD